MYLDKSWETLGLLLAGVVIIYITVLTIAAFNADARCASLGWANSKVTYNLQSYCIREENEYEITTPLSDLK